MLELKLIRENPELVWKDLERRGDHEKIAWVDELLRGDENWRKLLTARLGRFLESKKS